MKIELKKFNIETKFNDVVKLTDDIKAFVESTGVKDVSASSSTRIRLQV